MSLVTLLPGDQVDASQLPQSQKRRLGTSLKQDSTSTTSTVFAASAGRLHTDHKKRTAQITTSHSRYVPHAGDLVIAQVHHSSMDFFHLSLAPHTPQAILPQLAFEGATKKTRPQLKANDLVYAKVTAAQKNMEVEVSCVNPSTGKSEPDGLGPLNGGMVFDVSTGLAARILRKEGVVVLEELGEKLQGGFEVAVGKNGKVWVDCPEGGVKGICAVGKCLQETDRSSLTEKEQRKLVTRAINEMGLG
jgi:exosome complex component RRP40